MKLEKQLDSINHVAVLMHNDCIFLSQEILGLAFEVLEVFYMQMCSIQENSLFILYLSLSCKMYPRVVDLL